MEHIGTHPAKALVKRIFYRVGFKQNRKENSKNE